MLKGFGKDVILIAHMDEQKDGDAIKERLKIQGGSKDLVLTDSDVIARISIVSRQRQLVFSPTETSFGKDPAGVGDMELPDASAPAFKTCLGDVVTQIKEGLNALSDDQIAHKAEVEWFEQKLPEIKTPKELNEILGRAKKAGRDVAKMVVSRADELGCEFDGDRREYVYIEEFDPALKDDVEAGDNPKKEEAA